MNRLIYTVEWDGELTSYKQDFDNIDDARIALALHRQRNAVLKIGFNENY